MHMAGHWDQGVVHVTANLITGNVEFVKRTPDGSTPEETFEVVSITRETPRRKVLSMGIVRAFYDRRGIVFAAKKTAPPKPRPRPLIRRRRLF